MKPFLKHIKSFIRHILEFLIKNPRNLDEIIEIVTFDVIMLYTSIPHEFGLEAKDQEDLYPRFEKKIVLESENFVLENNTLNFDSKFYLQIKEAAMGTSFALTYANLAMDITKLKFTLLSARVTL